MVFLHASLQPSVPLRDRGLYILYHVGREKAKKPEAASRIVIFFSLSYDIWYMQPSIPIDEEEGVKPPLAPLPKEDGPSITTARKKKEIFIEAAGHRALRRPLNAEIGTFGRHPAVMSGRL